MANQLPQDRPQSNATPAPQPASPTPPDDSEESDSDTAPTPARGQSRRLKPEEVGFFDPDYEKDKEKEKNEPIVNAGKYIYYRDMFMFVDRLKEMTNQTSSSSVKRVITACFRGTASMWYTAELSELELGWPFRCSEYRILAGL